jgi:pimeloyl-ACP methyl ester carboxylesterase
MPYLDLDDRSVYYEMVGHGDPVLLLHGGFCSIETMRPQIEALTAGFTVHAPERSGHGRSPDGGAPFDYDQMAAQTLSYLDALGLARVDVVGFSDGAIIGLLLARDHPDRVRSLVAISGNLDKTGNVSEEEAEVAFSDAAWEGLVADYDRLSPDGPDHRPAVLARLEAMWTVQPAIAAESLSSISCPTLIMTADHDLYALPHTLTIRDAIPGAQLCVVPGATHMLLAERPDVVNAALIGFLNDRP